METQPQLPAIPNFALDEHVSTGPLFVLYAARQVEPQHVCYLQWVHVGMVADKDAGAALQHAAESAARLAHDDIAPVRALGFAGSVFWQAIELAGVENLAARIVSRPGWRDALSVARSLADALACAHEHGVIHGGLHPQVVHFGASGRAVVSGFGVTAELTAHGFRGLDEYLAPEQLAGSPADARSDLYSLGVLLYELLLGERPFAGKASTANRHLPPLPDGIGAAAPLVRRLLEVSPEQRPQKAQWVADELQRILDDAGGATVARGSTRVQPAPNAGATVVAGAQDDRTATRPVEGATRKAGSEATRAASDDATRATSAEATRTAATDATQVAAGDATEIAASGGTLAAGGERAAAAQGQPTARRDRVMPNPGDTIRGRFRIESLLGSGGMGKVYCALDLIKKEAGDDQPYVAMKVMRPAIATADMTFKALQREAKRAQDLAHPNIVTVYDLDRADGMVYMTMEMMRGEDADQRLSKHPHGFEPREARRIVDEVTAGLAYAHERGITHADLKPQNVYLTEDGRTKLLDFGIARAHKAARTDEVEEAFSGYTPAYASPEILAGGKAMPSDDVYALGCMAYYFFTGKHPFDKKPADQAKAAGLTVTRPKGMRRAEWRAVSRALDFDGKRRPKDGAEFGKRFSPSRVKEVVGGAVLVAGAIALTLGLMLGGGKGPAIPFKDLPPNVQASINKNLEDAHLYSSLKQLNPAIQLYNEVLQTHPGDLRATKGMNAVVEKILARTHESFKAGRLSKADAGVVYKTLMAYKSLPMDARNKVKQAQTDL